VLLMNDSRAEEKCVQNPPFPTYFPSSENELPPEQFHEKMFQFTSPTIVYSESADDVYAAAMRRAAVKKQAKAKRK